MAESFWQRVAKLAAEELGKATIQGTVAFVKRAIVEAPQPQRGTFSLVPAAQADRQKLASFLDKLTPLLEQQWQRKVNEPEPAKKPRGRRRRKGGAR